MASAKRFTAEQIVVTLREAEKLQAQGLTIPQSETGSMKLQDENGAKPASPQEDYLLDESYVLDIIVRPGLVIFRCDLALTERHPFYERPKADEAFCFRSGEIIWSDVREVIWSGQGSPPATDASGEIDYGHIDSLAADGQVYDLEGDWGRMSLTAGIFAIKLT